MPATTDPETGKVTQEGSVFKPYRVSENGVVGTREQIESDIVLPETRIKSIPETGTESNSGDIATEWNIDEQDPLFAAVMCSEWEDATPTSQEADAGITEKKVLTLGTLRKTFAMLKDYKQAPKEYQLFSNEQVNQVQIAMALNSFVKLTWSLMGANHPKSTVYEADKIGDLDVFSGMTFEQAMSTKSFKTLEGYIKYGDSFDALTQNRQISDFSLTINNNMESTQALFEMEAIESSLGDFEVTGSFEYWKAGNVARELYNDAIDGKDKCFEVSVSRIVGGVKTAYTIQLKVHLDSAAESRDGKKLKNTVEFTMGAADGLKFIKTVQTM